MAEKKSQFTTVSTVSENRYFNVFGQNTDEKISKPDFFNQIQDELYSPFIYPTVELLQAADLEADEDFPTYVRVEENQYKLYKITSLAPGAEDITLNNGATATFQVEYRDIGFVVGPASSVSGALAVFSDTSGTQLDDLVVPTATGRALITASETITKGYFSKDTDNTVDVLQAQPFFDEIKQSAGAGYAGAIKKSTTATVITGTADDEAVTPLTLQALTATETRDGLIEIATRAEAIDGDDQFKAMTPYTTSEVLAARATTVVNTFADLATTPATTAGMIVYVKQHTSGGVGGGYFQDTAGTITNNGGTLINNTVTAGRHWKAINYTYFTPEMFGCVGGANDTVNMQKCIDALSDWGVINGGGKLYNVTTLNFKSKMALVDIRFKTIGGSTDFVAPITIDGQTTEKENIYFFRVKVDGNRQNQTLIVSPGEDGGRHGFRILGNCKNIFLTECTATYCAGDGVEFFSAGSLPVNELSENLCFQNIHITNCEFNYNRRHGMSGDSINGLYISNTSMKFNGLDLNTSDPLTHGNRGARFAGNLYGRGFDLEGYGIGSRITNVFIDNCDLTENIAGILIYDSADPADPDFLYRDNIFLTSCNMDDSGSGASFTVYDVSATVSNQAYKNVNLTNCVLSTYLYSYGVDGLNVSGGSIVSSYSSGFYASIEKSKNYNFNGVRTTKPYILVDQNPASVTKTNVIGAPTFASITTDLIGFNDGGYVYKYKATVTGAVAAGYLVTLDLPSGFYVMPMSSSFVNSASGGYGKHYVSINAANKLNFGFDIDAAVNYTAEVIFLVKSNA